MRKLADLFTDLLLGPAPEPEPTPTGAAAGERPRPTHRRRRERVAEVVVVDHPDDHLHDVLSLFPAETPPPDPPPAARTHRTAKR